MNPLADLPIFPYLSQLAEVLANHGLLLLAAEPGAGKTTLLPWKLLSDPRFVPGKILLLEPRRLAARSAADRIASLLGEKTGQTVGLRTRLETCVSARTRLEVVTEGVLTRLLQADPGLEGVGTVLFDEFHTRSLQGDLGLALAWDSRKILRPDLRIGILSATLPSQAIQEHYGAWPLVEVPGRIFPVEVFYHPPRSSREKPWEAASRLCQEALGWLQGRGPGTILCFLPGYYEMHRSQKLLGEQLPAMTKNITLLHGQMPGEQQRRVLNPAMAGQTRIILATNVAETSLTIPGVKAVVDLGLERRVRFSPRTGMDHWDTVAISEASAQQRKGRAGRTGPGACFRWWALETFHEPYSPPEIAHADLAPLVLETALWGAARPEALAWVTPPPAAGVQHATHLLQALELLDADGKCTVLGRRASRLGVHPRLAAMVLAAEAEALETAAAAAALLENDDPFQEEGLDFREHLAAFGRAQDDPGSLHRPGIKRLVEDFRRILRAAGHAGGGRLRIRPELAGGLLQLAYPERVSKRTRLDDPITSRWLLASGRGALLKGPLAQEEFLVLADVDGGDIDAHVFLAAPITRRDIENRPSPWLQKNWRLDWKGWKPQATREFKYGAMVLQEVKGDLPPEAALQAAAAEKIRGQGLACLPWAAGSRRLLARCRFVETWGCHPGWPDFSETYLLDHLEAWLFPYGAWTGGPVFEESSLQLALDNRLGWANRKVLEELAPESWRLPSGSVKKLDYESGEVPTLSARLQEFFGCTTTPTVCGQPLLLDLLSPAGRTVQRTRDLDGFWDRAYPEVKKDLMGRYPRHAWPDNPRAAQATARAKPRPR